MLINLYSSQHIPASAHRAGLVLVNSIYHVTFWGICVFIFTFRHKIERLLRQAWMLFCARREEKRRGGEKKILFVCRCQVELCRDLVMSVWLCMYVCILEKLLWEAVYLPCTAKLILLTVWKIDAMSLSSCLHVSAAAAAAAPCRLGPRSTWWRCGSTSTASLVFLTLAPVLTWFCPLFSSIAASYVLLCLSLFPPLSCWQRLNVTPSAVTCCCAGVYEGECFISAAPGMDSGLAWPSLAWLGCTWPLQQAHKKQTLGVCVRVFVWACELIQGEFFF